MQYSALFWVRLCQASKMFFYFNCNVFVTALHLKKGSLGRLNIQCEYGGEKLA